MIRIGICVRTEIVNENDGEGLQSICPKTPFGLGVSVSDSVNWEDTDIGAVGLKASEGVKNPVGMKVEMKFNSRQHQIVILNGYVNPLKRHLYKENRRIKRIRVSGTSESKGNFSFEEEIEDVVHFHQIDIPARTSEVEIEILEFYEGEKYQDLCVQMFGIPYESASFTFSTNKTGEELMLLRMGTLWDGGSPK